MLGEALYNLGSFEDAETTLALAMERATGDDVDVSIAVVRRRNLFVGCRRDDEAAAVGGQLAASGMSASAAAELLSGEAEMLAYSGRPLDALAMLERVDVGVPRLGVLTAAPRAAALAMIGRTAEALALCRQAYDDQLALGDPLAIPSPGTHRVNELFALVQAGHLTEVDERGRAWLADALQAGMPLEVMWLAVHLARGALAQGRPDTTLGWSGRASQAIDAHRFEGLRPINAAIRAAALGLLGDASASAAAADDVDRLTSGFGALAVELPLGRAWALVAAGDLSSARVLLLAAADEAEARGFVPAAGWLLHDAARLGAADAVATRLATLGAASDSDLLRVRAEHAAGLVSGDGEQLAAAADRFETIGAVLLAAEAAAQAADALRRRGDRTRAAVLDARSGGLAARCEAATTPALLRAGTVVTLTGRQHDVAVLAAGGLSSQAIAAELSLSVRTVDNHLGHIYAKLGVSSRAQLASALELDQREDGRT